MELIKSVWDFFQGEILGMKWINQGVGKILDSMGLDTASALGGSIRFFIYDVIKINFIYPKLFPTGKK